MCCSRYSIEVFCFSGGLVFNLLLESCIENDTNRLSSSKSGNKESRSNRSSLTSLLDHQRDPNGSCESLPTKNDTDYLNSTFLPLYHTNIDRRSSQDDDILSINLPGVQRSQLKFQVPSIVLACTKYLEEYGLNTVGIFRVSTSKKRVRQVIITNTSNDLYYFYIHYLFSCEKTSIKELLLK